MRITPRLIVGLLVLLLLGSLVPPFFPNVESDIIAPNIITEDEYQDIEGWNDLNNEQQKAMVDWTRRGDSQDISLIGLSTTLPIDCGDQELSLIHN